MSDSPFDAAGPMSDDAVPQPQDDAAAEIARLTAERDELRDRWMRAMAEAENTRKRAEKDRRDAERYGASRLARDLLPVHDALERAIEAADLDPNAAAGGLVEGIQLTQRELDRIFGQHGVTVIAPAVGERFDPAVHEAMFEAPVPGTRAGDIIQVMSRGFMLHDRLLRAAQVGVSSTPAA